MSARLRPIARKGGKGGKDAGQKPTEYANTLRSKQTARVLEVLSEGVVAGLTSEVAGRSPWELVYLDKTPIQDSAGNYNFTVTQAEFRYGIPGQSPVPGYPLAEAESSVGVECTYNVPVTRALSGPGISAVRLTIQIPALYMQETDGDINGTAISYGIEVSVDGGAWTLMWDEVIWGKTMSPYQKSVRVQLPVYTSSVSARITRTTAPYTDSTTRANIYWSSYTEIRDGQISYDDTAIVSVVIDSEQFPSIPSRAYLLDGIMVDVPVNYDPRNRTYSGTWNGTFKTAWTNNPAWIVYALLVNDRWGLGRFLEKIDVDKWSFYDAAVWNDQQVQDGASGSGPRWTCNCVINTRQDAWTVATAVASSMLATLYYANGTVFLVQDRFIPSPTRIFGPAEVMNGVFDYSGTDYRSKFTACAVTWLDPEDQYQPTVELVQDQALVAAQGYKETQRNAFGATNRAQAIRFGRWVIYTSQFETEVCTFRVGLENADISPGELVAVSDPSRAGVRLAGRLLDDTNPTSVTLDKADPAIVPGWTLYLQVAAATA